MTANELRRARHMLDLSRAELAELIWPDSFILTARRRLGRMEAGHLAVNAAVADRVTQLLRARGPLRSAS